MALVLWIFMISPLLAMSVCVVAKCCILTHQSWQNKFGKKKLDEGEWGSISGYSASQVTDHSPYFTSPCHFSREQKGGLPQCSDP